MLVSSPVPQWLEAFVQHGTSQIDGVAAGVQQLCNELGPVPELQDGADTGEAPSGSLLTDIRRLLVQNNEREQSDQRAASHVVDRRRARAHLAKQTRTDNQCAIVRARGRGRAGAKAMRAACASERDTAERAMQRPEC